MKGKKYSATKEWSIPKTIDQLTDQVDMIHQHCAFKMWLGMSSQLAKTYFYCKRQKWSTENLSYVLSFVLIV